MKKPDGTVDVGGNIRQYREGLGWSQSRLAEEMGVPQQRITEWETGKREPLAQTIIKLAEALNADPGTLLE